MYYGTGNAALATRYQAVNAGRAEGTNAHGLVKILFEELLLAIDAHILALDQGDMAKSNEKNARAMSIIHALDSSLDFERGGEIAISLAQVYRESRRLLLLSAQNKTAQDASAARDIIGEIADAWARIG
jgi:flagellar secretion chaperone FliS